MDYQDGPGDSGTGIKMSHLKERKIRFIIDLPYSFVQNADDVYKHASGAHQALAFPDFLNLLIGLGLESYRKTVEDDGEKTKGKEDDWIAHNKDFTPKGITK